MTASRAFEDHGLASDMLTHDGERTTLTLDDLAVAGLDLKRQTEEPEQDGIDRCKCSRDALEGPIASQQRQAKAA